MDEKVRKVISEKDSKIFKLEEEMTDLKQIMETGILN